MNALNGKTLARELMVGMKEKVSNMFRIPGLAIVLAGDDPASHTYVRLKEQTAGEVGIHFEKKIFPANVSAREVIEHIHSLNEREDIHGIVVQLPLPAGLPTDDIIASIAPEKDVDGFHPDNVRLVEEGRAQLMPSLIRSIMHLVESSRFEFAGKKAALIVNSKTFVQPLAAVLHQRGMTVDFALPPFTDKAHILAVADLVIVAVGKPGFITGNELKDGVVLIDVGFTRGDDGRVHGDVDAASVAARSGWVTPVPGGVGPMTVAMLLDNTVRACQIQNA